MKKLFTLALASIFTLQIASAQEAGFYPPEGSTYNVDSTEITLPDAMVGQDYNETISFYATDEIELEGVPFALTFTSVEITNVMPPEGLANECNPADCLFLPNAWGESTITGVPTTAGEYTVDIEAEVSVVFGFLPITFSIPYLGGNPTIDMYITDYTVLNDYIPTFKLNVLPTTVGVEEYVALSDLVVSPNPANNVAKFDFTSTDEQVSLKVFDLLGNLISVQEADGSNAKQTMELNTTSFAEGVYIYQLETKANKTVGRLVVNH